MAPHPQAPTFALKALNSRASPMFIEAISMIYIQSASKHAARLGLQLKGIIGGIDAGPYCVGYLVARCTTDADIWVVSSLWVSKNAMEKHFSDPALRPFIDLLAGKKVRRIEFNSFINQYPTPANQPVREC